MAGSRSNRGWSRLGGFLVLLALVPSTAPDLFGVTCPHHAEHAEGHPSQPDGHSARDDADTGSAHHGEHRPADPTEPCTCVGECPVTSPVAGPDAPRAELPVDDGAPAATPIPAVASTPSVRFPRHRQPPATAPPGTPQV